jgi:hypothetical protein
MLLSGGRSDLMQQVDGRISGSRAAIEEARTLLRLARDDVRGYLRSI